MKRFFKRDGYESIYKDKNSVEDYTRDWTSYLNGDTISTSAWSVESGGVTIDSDTNDTTSATVWLSGAAGNYSIVRNRIVTAAGRTKDWSFRVYERET